ncbi:YqjF family protein [Brevibacillus choshinensis]|uniref:DUF2071 domain-containing protein n=1 Tax=Brevibacillus choshinensis TaxID=54911 RepID=A0ABX7FH74_BRECH|nr:DUF2071 domain-containing protein [Brevibacillus choshinensis]QRG65079.1 DUF2071 domain-containing protein [Brevibacillus choshinensis]
MTQTWEHLLFAHWAVPPALIRPLVPHSLEIDTYEGVGWISIIPFRMTGVRLRCLPPIPYTTSFPEINVRTYVKASGKSGIYFLSLDASNPLITTIAKRWYRLPYYQASMDFRLNREGVTIQSKRAGSQAQAKQFSAVYGPDSDVFQAKGGTLENWLTERYTLFCECMRTKRLHGANVYHEPWRLQKAVLQIEQNSLSHQHISLTDPPELALYARGVQSIVWPIQQIKAERGATW